MIILGIDPGFTNTGFGIVTKKSNKLVLLDYGTLNFQPGLALPHKIFLFHEFLSTKIIEHRITSLSLETPFLGKNAQNFLKLGYLRGIMYLNAHAHNLNLSEFSPREIKSMLTGFGGADKDQVARIISHFFPHIIFSKFDITDAIAIALCGLWVKKQNG